MIVPSEVRPTTTHLLGDCLCGHRHDRATPVINGPSSRPATDIGYIITNGELYQQVRYVTSDGLRLLAADDQLWIVNVGHPVEQVQIVRTIGTL